MGNLNNFYLMGRVARPPQQGAEGSGMVLLALAPGTGGRPPRGASSQPIDVEVMQPQASTAQGLRVGQAVFVRGQLRQESAQGEGAPARLVARVQALEILASGRPRVPRERSEEGEGSESGSAEVGASGKRRRRRRGGRGTRREGPRSDQDPGTEENVPVQSAASGESPTAEPPPPKPALPPPAPLAPAPPEPVKPPPDPTYKTDMPF